MGITLVEALVSWRKPIDGVDPFLSRELIAEQPNIMGLRFKPQPNPTLLINFHEVNETPHADNH